MELGIQGEEPHPTERWLHPFIHVPNGNMLQIGNYAGTGATKINETQAKRMCGNHQVLGGKIGKFFFLKCLIYLVAGHDEEPRRACPACPATLPKGPRTLTFATGWPTEVPPSDPLRRYPSDSECKSNQRTNRPRAAAATTLVVLIRRFFIR